MKIQEVVFQTEDDRTSKFGLNINEKKGGVHVSLFSLEENEGAPISNFLWSLRDWIKEEFLKGYEDSAVTWSLTSGDQTTRLNYQEIDRQPLGLSLTNKRVIDWIGHSTEDSAAEFAYTREKYEEEYDMYDEEYSGGIPLLRDDLKLQLKLEPKPIPSESHAIPTDHPDAPDGIFYMSPPMEMKNEELAAGYHYVLVDTQKLIDKLMKDDRSIMKDAEKQFGKFPVSDWMVHNTPKGGRDTGTYYFREGGLRMGSGDVSILHLINELKLPYVPIAVQTDNTPNAMQELMEQIGYESSAGPRAPIAADEPRFEL